MHVMENRVVITGMGIWSCLGTDLESVNRSLYEGVSGVVYDPVRKEMGFRSALTGMVPMPDSSQAAEGLYARAGQVCVLRYQSST